MQLTDAYEIADYIKKAKKVTPVKAYIKGNVTNSLTEGLMVFRGIDHTVLIGQSDLVMAAIKGSDCEYYHLEYDRRNSAIPLLDTTEIQARIEPGAIIRDHVTIGKNAVIMMGAVVNIGACIGDGAMLDMNCVVGARGMIGKNVHVGAGAVVAGVLEPPSKDPVIIEDDVMIGANAVILEGVRVGKNAVVAAGAIVIEDVPPNSVVAGSPARVIKQKDEKTISKTLILKDLRE